MTHDLLGPADQPLFKSAYKARLRLKEILRYREDESYTNALLLTEHICSKQRPLVLYIGAGVNMSVNVKDDVNYQPCTWKDLLVRLLSRFDLQSRHRFIDSLVARANREKPEFAPDYNADRIITYLLQEFDKLQVAWFLTDQFRGTQDRNEAIFSCVEPRGTERTSPLIEGLMRLPYNDIITTNYDSNIEHFFRKFKKDGVVVSNRESLKSSFKGPLRPRLIYLHGKATPNVGATDLVFDRFDYGRVMAERDGLLDYVTYLLGEAHVVYVGFGLDDPTFNLIETRLHSVRDTNRPRSFAFVNNATRGECANWRNRKLYLIDYSDHDHIVEILSCTHAIERFVNWAAPEYGSMLTELPSRRLYATYMNGALKSYVCGDYRSSLQQCRAALALTLFWEEIQEIPCDERERLPFDDAVKKANTRIRMALNHYKLAFTPQTVSDRSTARRYVDRMNENLERACDLIKELEQQIDGHSDRTLEMNWLENATDILKARLAYHDDRFSESRDIYRNVIKRESTVNVEEIEGLTLAQLRPLEGTYYASCQIGRIAYQFRREDESGNDDRPARIDELASVQERATKCSDRCIRLWEQAGRGDEQIRYFANSFWIIARIAQWTAGRHAIGAFDDVIPTSDERKDTKKQSMLQRGIALLTSGECDGKSVTEWNVSPRWKSLRLRYLARGYALKWFLSTFKTTTCDDSDLFNAYAQIHEAMDFSSGPGLGRQSILNMLDAARLGILVEFVIRRRSFGVVEVPHSLALPHVSFYLNKACRSLRERSEESAPAAKPRISWDEMMLFRLASYYRMVGRELTRKELDGLDPRLSEFLSLSIEQASAKVIEMHERYGEANDMSVRAQKYAEAFRSIRDELKPYPVIGAPLRMHQA